MDSEVCWKVFFCRDCAGETREEHLFEVAHEIHECAILTSLE